jgi:cytochrome b561
MAIVSIDSMKTADSYTSLAKSLHWLMAIMIAGMLALGLYMHDLPFSPEKLRLYSWHKWFGVTLFVLVWVRLAWRMRHPAPKLPATLSPLVRRAAHAGHATLYILMIAIPLSGWLMSSALGFQTVWFGVIPIPDLISRDRALADLLVLVHKSLNVALMLTLAGHVLAALWHHFILKDDTLRRMHLTRPLAQHASDRNRS